MRVLVTDGETKKALAAVRALAATADEVGVASRFPVSVGGASRFADRRHWLHEREPGALVAALNRLGERGYDHLLPVAGRTFEMVSEHRDRLAFPVERILPDREAMRTALSKPSVDALARSTGVPSPATVSLTDQWGIDTALGTVGTPAVVKARTEAEPRFVRVVHSREELATARREYVASRGAAPLVQEYLPGVGRGFFGLYVDGELLEGYAHRRIREYPPEGGASACAASERDEQLREYSRRLLEPLEWTGVAMVEFKEDAGGTPRLIEINPKLWGSLDLTVASGLNFPAALVELSAGADPSALEFEFAPRRVHWPLSGDLSHAWRRPGSAPAVARDLLSRETGSNLRLDDPLPHAVEAAVTLVRRDA